MIYLPGYQTARVVADPDRHKGQPVFASGGARLADVLPRLKAGTPPKEVSEEFGVPLAELADLTERG